MEFSIASTLESGVILLTNHWIPGIDHLSASSISKFLECPESWRLKYIKGEPDIPNIYAIWGTAHHAAIHKNMKQKVESKEDCSTMEVLNEFEDTLEEEIALAGPDLQWRKETYANVRNIGVKLVSCYHKTIAPTIEPIRAEEEFNFVDEILPVPIKGIIDIETQTKVIDLKTSSRRVLHPKDEWTVQGHIYQLVSLKPVDWHICVKAQAPYVLCPPETWTLRMDLDMRAQGVRLMFIKDVIEHIEFLYKTRGPDLPWSGTGVYNGSCWKCPYNKNQCWWTA